MSLELVILLCMLATFALSVFVLKMPAGASLVIAALVGLLLDGQGIPIRHLVEGGFGFLDAILIIATAMVFMKVVEATGALSTITYLIIKTLHRSPALLMIVIMFFVMFPGMLTGLSSACVLTTGALVTPALLAMGLPRIAAGSFIAMGAIFGEIAPPICITAMIIGGGVDMPYVGFTGPLLIASFPMAILTALYFKKRYLKSFDVNEILSKLEQPVHKVYGFKLFIPIIFVVVYLIAELSLPNLIPQLGVPLIFMIGAVLGIGTGKKINLFKSTRQAISYAAPVMAILIGVGVFLQVLTLTGARGYLAVSALELPEATRYLAALLMPLFGSEFTAASVVGVPLVYVFLGKDTVVVTAALAIFACLGDLMPPPSLVCAYAAQTVKVKNHFKILKYSVKIMIPTLIVGFLMLLFANEIKSFLDIIF